MKPPIAPLGLEYVADRLARQGYDPIPCDLAFADAPDSALAEAIDAHRPAAIAVSVRNIDDAYFASQDFVLERTAAIVRRLKHLTDAPVVLGGVGFAVAPKEVLAFTDADWGLIGDSAEFFPLLLDRLLAGQTPERIPGVVHRTDDRITVTPGQSANLTAWPTPERRWFDNLRYFEEGGQAGIETKRGCPGTCVYCVESAATSLGLRLRTPESVVAEFRALLDQGIDAIHLCDSEFNLPYDHAAAVCAALIAAGLGKRIRWYVYAAPAPFDAQLAQAMARAGCVGINFGVDHADAGMLKRLGRTHTADDIASTVQACREAGLAVMLDMLFGGPGETRESLARAVDAVHTMAPDRVGLSCGVRVYPNTQLAHAVAAAGPLGSNPHLCGTVEGNDNLLRPIFYVDAGLEGDIHDIVSDLVRGDPRFLHANPNEIDGNYNYNDNSTLSNAIRNGDRGAYWDILRTARSD